jgi:cytochrome c oxidase subunit 2
MSARVRYGLLVAVTALVSSACDGALDPKSPQASHIADAWWAMLAASIVIFALVIGLLAYALAHRRSAVSMKDPAGFVLAGGLVLPVVVLAALTGLSVWVLNGTDTASSAGDVHIDVTAHDWWWDVSYPDEGVRTANEIHVPVGHTVVLTGTSGDVIHSFWAPELNGKIDLIPGKTNMLKFRADEPMVVRGQCAEFCGIAHGKMAFYVVVESEADYRAWLTAQQAPAVSALDSRAAAGQQVFFNNSCAVCHGIKGTPADGGVGPDLTHLASRSTFGAGFFQINADNLSEWVRDPRDLKPGVNMPSFSNLSDDEVQDLVAYLLSLK